MTVMRARFAVLLLVATSALALSGLPASAHAPAYDEYDQPASFQIVDGPTVTWRAATAPVAFPTLAVAAALALLGAASRRPRRVFALALVAILALFAFQDGVHSVHHLNDPTGRTTCAVAAAAATHVAAPATGGCKVEAAIVIVAEKLPLEEPPRLDVCPLAAHQGRAPPLAA
jgi:hypothetical protein